MDRIQDALRKHSTRAAITLICLMILFIYLFFALASAEGENYVMSFAMLISAIFFFLFLFPIARGCIDITKNRTWRKLDELGYADKFISTIDSELRNNCLLEHNEKTYDLILFITQTWFVLISNDGSTIRKTKEISQIYNDTTLDAIVIEFHDGSYFAGGGNAQRRRKVIRMCEEVLPNIGYKSE